MHDRMHTCILYFIILKRTRLLVFLFLFILYDLENSIEYHTHVLCTKHCPAWIVL